MPRTSDLSKAAAAMGRAGRGRAKVRGDAGHYSEMGKRSAAAKASLAHRSGWHKEPSAACPLCRAEALDTLNRGQAEAEKA